MADNIETIVTSDWDEVESICQRILQSNHVLIGMDAEGLGINSFGRYKVSLVQLAFGNEVFLIQIDRIRGEALHKTKAYLPKHLIKTKHLLPKSFIKLMKSKQVIKVGVDITNDIDYLWKVYQLKCQGFIDLQDIATVHGIADISMIGLLRQYFPERDFDHLEILKQTQREISVDDWDDLTPQQIEYAAFDGCWSLLLGNSMLNRTNEVNVYTTIDFGLEINSLYCWLKPWFIEGRYRPIRKIINQVVNSYSPWRKIYTLNKRNEYALHCLNLMVEQKLFNKDSAGSLSIVI